MPLTAEPNVKPGDVPLIRRPQSKLALPVVVSIPHFGTRAIRGFRPGEYLNPDYGHFTYGFADAFAPELYGALHTSGATVIATHLSRMFVDLNRPRDDFDCTDGRVHSGLGVVRTHTRRGEPILREFPYLAEVEQRLADFYDPYYAALKRELPAQCAANGKALLIDAHTASERGLGKHHVVIGTRRRKTAAEPLVACAEAVFTEYGFAVTRDLRGYIGANIVRTFGRPAEGVHAMQIEINSGLLHTMTHRELVHRVMAGERPPPDAEVVAKLQICLQALVAALAQTVASLLTRLSGYRIRYHYQA